MPIPSLPVEIIEQVIKSSLPPLIFSTFKKRYSLLKRYSLVVSTWRELAQRELWREVLVTEENSSQVQRAIGQVCHEKVRGVWIGWIHETPGRVLLDLRKAGIHPRRIAAWRGQLGSMVWSLFSDVQDLTLRSVNFNFSSPAAPLSRLTHLYLIDPYMEVGGWPFVLNPLSLPSLRHLKVLRTDMLGNYHAEGDEFRSFSRGLLSIAPQLVSLALSEDEGGQTAASFTSVDWQRFKNLQSLIISYLGNGPESPPSVHLTSLPPTLLHLVGLRPGQLLDP